MKTLKSYIWIIPSIFFIILLITGYKTDVLALPASALAGFGAIYLLAVPQAAKAARLGNKALAIKSLIGAFAPLLGSLNAFIYKLSQNAFIEHYISSAKSGAVAFKHFLVSITPQYGATIYTVLIAIIVIGVNLIIIQKFLALTRKILALVPIKAVEKAAENM